MWNATIVEKEHHLFVFLRNFTLKMGTLRKVLRVILDCFWMTLEERSNATVHFALGTSPEKLPFIA